MDLKLLQGLAPANPNLTRNNAGGLAYRMEKLHNLAQIATTSFLGNTYYTTAEQQLTQATQLVDELPALDVAKVAIWAKERGLMKDFPVILTTKLILTNALPPADLEKLFTRIIKNGKDIGNFIAIVRSGVFGRKSLGTFPKRLVNNWLEAQSLDGLFAMSVGNTPSLGDVLKLAHPRPSTTVRAAFYGWLLGKEVKLDELPQTVQDYLQWKLANDSEAELPNAPYLKLSSETLSKSQWKKLARRATFNQLRSALAAFGKHDVYEDNSVVTALAAKLGDPAEVARSRALPYNLLSAYMANLGGTIPHALLAGLENAVEASVQNVPEITGSVRIFLDVSGSMSSPIGGHTGRGGNSMNCSTVGAFIASCMQRKNPQAKVYRFDHTINEVTNLKNGRVLQNAMSLRANGGGTDCALCFKQMIQDNVPVDFAIVISDNESWGVTGQGRYNRDTGSKALVDQLLKKNPNMKIVFLDLTPNNYLQVENSENCLNLGGFSDGIYQVIAEFASGGTKTWTEQIQAIAL